MKFGRRRTDRADAPAPVDVPIRDEMIRLGQFLKLANLIENGSDARIVCADAMVVSTARSRPAGRETKERIESLTAQSLSAASQR